MTSVAVIRPRRYGPEKTAPPMSITQSIRMHLFPIARRQVQYEPNGSFKSVVAIAIPESRIESKRRTANEYGLLAISSARQADATD